MVNEKYIMLDLNDSRSIMIAEAMANKTCKKILSLLADKELSEGDIAKELDMPINTIEYNLKKLLSTGLIEKAKAFFWSVRGKKIDVYRLANKKIIISTKSKISSGIIASALIFGALGFFGNVAKNIFAVSRQVYSNNADIIIEKVASSENLGEISLGSAAQTAGAGNVLSNTCVSFFSIFHNVWLWVGVGIVIGVLGYFAYIKVKGGKN